MEYLSLPCVMRDGYLDRCNLHESLTYSVGLILSSRPGIMPFLPDYGCDVWDKEFSDLYSANKADLRSSLRNAIDRHEKRLFDVSVTLVNVVEHESKALGMAVRVTGSYREDGEVNVFDATYHLG